MVCTYLNNLLVIIKQDLADHLIAIKNILQILAELGLKVNSEKSLFGCIETKCLVLLVNKNGVIPLSSKVDFTNENGAPTKVRGMCQFVGIFHYYMAMWLKSAHTLDTLTKLCSTNAKFRWSDVKQNDFILMKKIFCGKVPLS